MRTAAVPLKQRKHLSSSSEYSVKAHKWGNESCCRLLLGHYANVSQRLKCHRQCLCTCMYMFSVCLDCLRLPWRRSASTSSPATASASIAFCTYRDIRFVLIVLQSGERAENGKIHLKVL